MDLKAAIALLTKLKTSKPRADKAEIERIFISKSQLHKAGALFFGDGYTLRFSEANKASFSNTVLSLSRVKKYDSCPVVICIVRTDHLDFRMANSTFLKRISHSSQALRVDNIKGSFNGADIMDEYEGIPNRPAHFEELFAIHSNTTWVQNLERLVEATSKIASGTIPFEVSPSILKELLQAPARAKAAMSTETYRETERKLAGIVQRSRKELIEAAESDNAKNRGDRIEQIISGELNEHRLDDLTFPLPDRLTLLVDVKSKLLDRKSAPKAYNIDKLLRTLAKPDKVFAVFFVGLDTVRKVVHSRLISVFDPTLLKATHVQTHWSGRASRGATQFTGDLSPIFATNYEPTVDIEGGKRLLREFVKR